MIDDSPGRKIVDRTLFARAAHWRWVCLFQTTSAAP